MATLESIALGFAQDRMDLIVRQLAQLTPESRGGVARTRAKFIRRNIRECRTQLKALDALVRMIEEENA
jgi:hypothetical protein